MREFLKKIRYLLEALIVEMALGFFKILGPKNSSNFASFLARHIGKRHSTNELAMTNLGRAFPHFNLLQKEKIIEDMWDNLGRVVGEYAHLSSLSAAEMVEKHVTFENEDKENIEYIKKNFPNGGIIFSAHIGNWETGPKIFNFCGFDASIVYRPLNNKYVEKITAKMRGAKLIAKGSKGGRQIIDVIKNSGYVAILMDQKISEGEPVRFFHDDAITATSIARIALKYNVPLIPARSIRVDHQFKFKAKIEKPLDFTRSGNLNDDILRLTLLINKKLESWIEQNPAQWFWVHNRWKK